MKSTSGLFLFPPAKDKDGNYVEPNLVELYTKKIKDIQDSGVVGKEYEGKIDGVSVKFWLPQSVKKQYQAVIKAESFLQAPLYTSTDDAYALRMYLWDMAKENMLYDGKSACNMDDDDFTVDFIEQAIVVYLGELLFPLFHRSCTKAKEVLVNSLTKYMSSPVSI